MISYFRSLGERIERAWRERNYDEEVFTPLALAALEEGPPSDSVQAADVVDWVFSPEHEFSQPNHPELFGEPPVMLFQASRFYIEALFWLSGTTAIHQHSFSGVFAVLAGSSVHSHWRFTPERTINSRMICGRLQRVATEILRPGGMREIHAGDRLIHQLFHLELPSVTIVVRTSGERRHLPQYSYLLPGLALDPEDRDGLRTRRLLFLQGMARGHLAGLPEHAGRLIEVGDLETLFYMFSLLTRRKVDPGLLDELYGLARRRHGDVVDLFQAVCEGERRTRVVTALRAKITDPEARFLLALLMLMLDRDAIFETVSMQFPGDEPLAAIERWVAGMSGKETIGFEFDDVNRLLFRGLVEGLDGEGLLRRLRDEFRGDSVDAHRERLLAHARQLAKSDLFHSLLTRSPLRMARVA
ncbi:MAG TPA: hypothetical protein VN999_01490 [Thermoanaerobaculia bacterium]|nr:hypothetical protein [Thermoanaerobaculia bacterium]